ncbi:hypothetical protein D9M71_241600 [compost metagenome]
MLGDEQVVAVFGRELLAGVEAHAEGGDMRAELGHRRREGGAGFRGEFRVGDVPGMAVRIAEVLAVARYPVQLVVGQVVAEHVAAVVGEPEFLRLRMPGKTDRVAHPVGHHLAAAAIDVHALQIGVARAFGTADVARRADRHIELAVRAEGDELPAVVGFAREFGRQRFGLRRLIQMRLDVAQDDNPADRRDVQIAVAEGDTDGHLQVIGNHSHTAAIRRQRIHLSRFAAQEQCAALAPGHGSRAWHLVAEDLDAEAIRQLDVFERRGAMRRTGKTGQQCDDETTHGRNLRMDARFSLDRCLETSARFPLP